MRVSSHHVLFVTLAATAKLVTGERLRGGHIRGLQGGDEDEANEALLEELNNPTNTPPPDFEEDGTCTGVDFFLRSEYSSRVGFQVKFTEDDNNPLTVFLDPGEEKTYVGCSENGDIYWAGAVLDGSNFMTCNEEFSPFCFENYERDPGSRVSIKFEPSDDGATSTSTESPTTEAETTTVATEASTTTDAETTSSTEPSDTSTTDAATTTTTGPESETTTTGSTSETTATDAATTTAGASQSPEEEFLDEFDNPINTPPPDGAPDGSCNGVDVSVGSEYPSDVGVQIKFTEDEDPITLVLEPSDSRVYIGCSEDGAVFTAALAFDESKSWLCDGEFAPFCPETYSRQDGDGRILLKFKP